MVARAALEAVEARIAADEAKLSERSDIEAQTALAAAAGKAERLLTVRRAEEALTQAEQLVQKARAAPTPPDAAAQKTLADSEKKWTTAKKALADAQNIAAKETAAYS